MSKHVFARSALRSLGLATALCVVACSSATAEKEEEEVGTSESASCATSPPDGAGGVWLNYRANEIGCPNEAWVNPLVRAPASYDGRLMQGRIRCGYEWLRANQPDVFQSLGRVTSNETPYTSPGGFNAWYNQFSSGSKVQFEWGGPCSSSGHGFIKFYVVPCQFVASPAGRGMLYESPSCGTTLRETHSADGSITVEATSGGVRGLVRLVRQGNGYVAYAQEGDFRAAQIAMSQLRRAREFNRISAKPGFSIDWGCVGASLAVVAGVVGVVAGCGIPEPAHPLVCGGAIIGITAAGASFVHECN